MRVLRVVDLLGTVVPSEGRKQAHVRAAIQAELLRLAAGHLGDKMLKQTAKNTSRKLHKKFFDRKNKTWTENVESDQGKAYLQLVVVELPDAEEDPALDVQLPAAPVQLPADPVQLPADPVEVPEATERPLRELHDPGEGTSQQVCARRLIVFSN